MNDPFDGPVVDDPELDEAAKAFSGGWNYRVIRTDHKPIGNLKMGPTFNIYEVYYDEEGNPTACSQDPLPPMGEADPDHEDLDDNGLESLRHALELYTQALERPILKWSDFPFDKEE